MKQIFWLLFYLLIGSGAVYGQFPANPNKIRLGNQTTGDGLIYRTDSIPNWTPSDVRNAWVAFDTVAGVLYYYQGGTWNSFTSGGAGIDSIAYASDTLYIYTPAETFKAEIIAGSAPNLTFTNALGPVKLSAGADSVAFDDGTGTNVTQSGGTLYYNLNSIGTPGTYTSVTTDAYGRVTAGTNPGFVTVVDSTRVLSDSIAVYYQNGSEIGRDTIRVPVSGGSGTVTSISQGVGITATPNPITTTGTIAADTTVLGSKAWTNNQLILKLNISDTAAMLAPYLLGSELLPTWTTAGRPGTPSAGRTGYNTTAGNLDFYGAAAWENPVRSATATGLGTATRLFYANADGRAAADDANLTWDYTNKVLTVRAPAVDGLRPALVLYGPLGPFNPIQRWYNSTPTEVAQIANDGSFYVSTVRSIASTVANRTLTLVPSNAAVSNASAIDFLTNNTFAASTNAQFSWMRLKASFSASSGGNHQSILYINPSIFPAGTNTTEFAGVDIDMAAIPNPSVMRALRIRNSSGTGIYQSSTAITNNLAGNTHIGATTTPARTLHVTGEARITDLTTDTPTQIVGADADGDLGAITVGSGLSLSAGTLTATGGVSDGDKGDVDVTSSGAVWTVDTNAVTTVKISDGSVTQDKLASGAAGGAKLGGLTYISADDVDVNLSSYLSIDWLTNYSQLVVWLRIGNTASRTVTFPTPSSTYQGKVVEIFFGATNGGTHFGQITAGGTNRITYRTGANVATATTYDGGQALKYMRIICAQDPNTLAYQWLVLDERN